MRTERTAAMRTEGTAAARTEGTAVMRIIASRRASVLGAVSHDAVDNHTTLQGYGMGMSVMRRVASQRAARQAGTSRPITADRIGNVSFLSLLF